MDRSDDLDPQQVHSILASLDTSPALGGISRPENGLTGSVFLLQTDQQDLVLRAFSTSAAAWKPEKERLIFDLLRRQGVPVPKVLKTDLSRSLVPFAYAIAERVPGVPLGRQYAEMSAAQRVSVYRQLGDFLGRIHSLSFPACGDVMEQGGIVTAGPAQEWKGEEDDATSPGPFGTWQEMHRLIVRHHLLFLQETEFGDLAAPLGAWFGRHEAVIDRTITPRLLHMDLHAGNILVQDDTITAILDVEEALIGHHEFDLMRTELAHFRGDDPGIQEAFYEEYTRHVTLEEGYEKRKPFYEMSRSLVGLRCLVTYGSRYSSGAEDERHAARTRIGQLLRSY